MNAPGWRIERRAAEGLLVVTTEGEYALAPFVAMVRDAYAAAQEHGDRRFVFDHSRMRPVLSTSEIYQLPEQLERVGWSRGMRVAVVHPPGQRGARQFEFFANLAVARSFQYQLFEELDQAVAWALAD